jgi:hypothetical protein
MLKEYHPVKCNRCGETWLTMEKIGKVCCPICKSCEFIVIIDRKDIK